MGMSAGGGGGDKPMGEMNTTPLIDVMLVLLIMFIITLPPITSAVNIDLPVDDGSPPPPNQPDPVINKIYITPASEIQWNGTPVTIDQVVQYLQQTKAMQPVPELQFQPDPATPYLIVDEVLAEIKRAEVANFGFVGNEQYRQFGKAAIPPR
ncbi:biopolymer transporter ExbD [Sphingorhabdus lutea]|uniref:Biopolymer transporter ExbD n=1 Tax=Sphingorhabdus lutea TaxID=1913578 RepID=A0A1L3JAH8_9SPHN|nr:biopolymer transporter ExbD [Sphingorhabdus lutea]APG62140.1 biopolymer transporter ExbD [Sphingorhabdus lutea]